MIKRWILYLTAWIGCLIFYYAYDQWLGWVLLAAVSALPVCGLLLGLPAMLTARLELQLPARITVGTDAALVLTLRSALPAPRWSAKVQAYHALSGKTWLLAPGGDFPVDRCGVLACTVSRGRVYDYLGLFRLPLKTPEPFRLVILPQREKVEPLPNLERHLAAAWQPKPGGGYSEQHELRLYRPGDSLRQIHWKLSGKTGKLILRQSMVPQGNQVRLWLSLDGDADQLERKLGRLLWLSEYLLSRQVGHDVVAQTGDGVLQWEVCDPRSLQQTMEELMSCRCLPDGVAPAGQKQAGWQYCIGGDGNETP